MKAVDPGYRLPGEAEAEESPIVDDARHWEEVYAELLQFKRGLVSTVEVAQAGADQSVAHEVGNDAEILRAELDRLERRYRFWRERVGTLTR